MQKNTKVILLGGAILLVLILLVKSNWSPADQSDNIKPLSTVPTSPTTDSITTPTTPTTQPNTPTKTIVAPKTTTPVMNYTDLVNKYIGYRFQFANNCSTASPSAFVIKSGSKFMIDNRENIAHTFTFDKQKYAVKPYGYVIITTRTAGTQAVFCDGVQRVMVNVAQ